MIDVLIVDDNKNLIELIEKSFSKINNIKIKYKAYNGKEAIKIIDSKSDYDLIILDLIMPNKDGLYVLEFIKENEIDKKIIVSTSFSNDNMIKKISKYNIDYIMMKPYELSDLESIISNVVFGSKTNNILDKELISILHDLGFSSHIKGYKYIIDGIKLVINNPIERVTKELYPRVAKKYNTTSSRVEAAIRHAIEVSWNKGDLNLIDDIFRNSIDMNKAKPTNSEFITTIAEKLRLEYNII